MVSLAPVNLDRRAPVPLLHALLSRRGHPMLAVGFDSLLILYEQAFGRHLVVGSIAGLSDDERLLANLLCSGGRIPAELGVRGRITPVLDCALSSLRMLIFGTASPGRLMLARAHSDA